MLHFLAIPARFIPSSLASPTTAAPPPGQELTRAKGIPHEIVRQSHPLAAHPNHSPVLDVRFPSLTHASFRHLRRAYGSWSPGSKSRVKYDPARQSYSITDFLPPALQALHGCCFEPETNEEGSVHLHYQCWGHALDVLCLAKRGSAWRQLPRWLRRDDVDDERLTLACPDSRDAWAAIRAHTTLVARGFNSSGRWAAEANLQPGDLVLIYHDNTGSFKPGTVWLDHCAIWIDRSLLWEKAGSGASTPFRLVDTETFGRSWDTPPGVFRAEVRRPKRWKRWLSTSDLSLRGRYAGTGGGMGGGTDGGEPPRPPPQRPPQGPHPGGRTRDATPRRG